MPTILSPDSFFFPALSIPTQTFFRAGYGIFLLGTLLSVLPHARRYFLGERWGGYAYSDWTVNLLHHPKRMPWILGGWLICAVLLIIGRWILLAALLNFALCRYYFIHMRWKSLLRGMGAPGFMTYWLAAAVLLLECTLQLAPSVRPLALLVVQTDFALIMLSAGIYKLTSGYAKNDGMELGLANPMWGYWWKAYLKMPVNHWMIRTLNHMAWSTEVAAGIMMLIPSMRFIGAMLILLSFLFVATQIRLCLLPEMVVTGCVLFFHPGSAGDTFVSGFIGEAAPAVIQAPAITPWVAALLEPALWMYLILLPFAHAGLYYNLYLRRKLPWLWLQSALEAYTNLFGILIWRVFSIDIVNFFVRIYQRERGQPEAAEKEVTRFGWRAGGLRFSHVAESIALASLFTTLKYYPSRPHLFAERLMRFAWTLGCPGNSVLSFEYIVLLKEKGRFVHRPLAQFTVDPASGTIVREILDETLFSREIQPRWPVTESSRPGSYAPAK
ncbi:MAG: hypothetical protein HYZ11_00150 [Candidatus Tectomicrobia bacterium]|uniref:Uncharacterized protein n=1 Tax=Tectimicrobiota bacterium TaxID=2528274 RepID=A0A932MLV4_UNCTE|nr:hypothetical protein [Candidatus Tectomicrobia bacterium]